MEKNITINIEKLIEKVVINTSNDIDKIKDQVTRALIDAVNEFQFWAKSETTDNEIKYIISLDTNDFEDKMKKAQSMIDNMIASIEKLK
jgi:ethanolamine ammonia-lyase large subunit